MICWLVMIGRSECMTDKNIGEKKPVVLDFEEADIVLGMQNPIWKTIFLRPWFWSNIFWRVINYNVVHFHIGYIWTLFCCVSDFEEAGLKEEHCVPMSIWNHANWEFAPSKYIHFSLSLTLAREQVLGMQYWGNLICPANRSSEVNLWWGWNLISTKTFCYIGNI